MRLIFVLSVLLLQGCAGVLTSLPVYSSASPDGKAKVQVEISGCFGDCVVKIVVKQGWRSNQILAKSDCLVQFAHASWSGSRVGVFVDGGYCGPLKVAFDTASHQTIDFKIVEADLRSSIINSYRVTQDELQEHHGDVFAWAKYPGDGIPRRSTKEFRSRTSPQ